jgi:hypothetical protein
MKHVTWMAAALLVLAQPLAGQVIRGRVMEDRTGNPVAAASVTVLDDAGQPAGYAQSGAFGEFIIRLKGPGRFFVRAERVGYRAATSGLSDVGTGDDVYRLLVLTRGDAQLEGAGTGIGGIGFLPRVLPGARRAATDTRPAASGAPADATPSSPASPGSKKAARRPEPRPPAAAKPRGDERPSRAPRPSHPSARGGRNPGVL